MKPAVHTSPPASPRHSPGKIQKPGERPNRPGPYREVGPRGGEVPNPRRFVIEPSDPKLPPTQEPGHNWERRLTSPGERRAAVRGVRRLDEDLFGPDRDGDHPQYRACRDHPSKRGTRLLFSRLWNASKHLLAEGTTQFASEFRRDFPARAWEVHVLHYLQRSGVALATSPPMGPDFKGVLDGRKLWVECVIVTSGVGDDAVLQPSKHQSLVALGPSEKVALRYASALTSKLAKIAHYRKKGIIATDDAVLVALHQANIQDSDLHDWVNPVVLRVLFGIGEPTIAIDPYAGTTSRYIAPMPWVAKFNKAVVPTRLFLDEANCGVSGVLFSRSDTWALARRVAKRMYLVHNQSPLVVMPNFVLPVRGEAWVEGGLVRHVGVLARHGPLSKNRRVRRAEGLGEL